MRPVEDTQSAEEFDIAVVGLGPVGAYLACLLAQYGLRVVALERNAEIYPMPRAGSIDHETLRAFQRVGVVDEIADMIIPVAEYQFVSADDEVLIEASYPQGPQPYGTPGMMFFWQPTLEQALRRRMSELGVDMRLGATVTSVEKSGSSAVVSYEGGTGPSAVTARFVLASDGGASTVRKALNIALEDFECDERWLAVDARQLIPFELPQARQICDPARPTGVFTMPGDFRRWLFMILPDEDSDEMKERWAQLVSPWAREDQIEIVRLAVYTFHGLVAREWRSDNVFLLGDSAHQTPPNLGQGLCSGIRDATNLAWKLAAVIEGGADGSLLDSYEIERIPHMRAIVAKSVELGRELCTIDPDQADERNRRLLQARREGGSIARDTVLPPILSGLIEEGAAAAGSLFIQPRVGSGELYDDHLGEGFAVVTRPGVSVGARVESISGLPVRYASFTGPDSEESAPGRPRDAGGFLSDWFETHGADFAVIRPDRYVFTTGPAESLDAALASLARRCGAQTNE